MANAQPCKLETLWLPDQRTKVPQAGLEWDTLLQRKLQPLWQSCTVTCRTAVHT